MKTYPPIVQTASFKNIPRDEEAQVKYQPKSPRINDGVSRRVYRLPQYRTRGMEEIRACQAEITNHPDFDKQMEALSRIFGKQTAEDYLAKVLDNQKIEEVSPGHYETVRT